MQSVAEAILQNGAGAIGPGQPMPIAGLQTVAFTLSGVFVATVTFEATTVDDPQPGDWYPINAHQSGTAILGTTGTGPGIYRASIAGLAWVRARVSAWTSGAVTVNGKAVAVDDNSKLVNANLTGSNTAQAQVITNQSVAAGATFNAPWEDLSAYTKVAYGGNGGVSHNWTLTADVSPDNNNFGGSLGSFAAVSTGKSLFGELRLTWARATIINSDTAPRSYSIWRRAFAGI